MLHCSQSSAEWQRYCAREPPDTRSELEKWRLDPEDKLKQMVAEFENTYNGGEAYPTATINSERPTYMLQSDFSYMWEMYTMQDEPYLRQELARFGIE